MAELFTNLARSTLASGIAAGGLSLTVQATDGNALFPSPGGGDFFRCLLYKKATGEVEIITCTSRSADVLTIARAQEEIGNITPAVAYAFDAGDIVELRPSAAFYTALAAGATSTNIQQGTFLYGVDTGAADVYTVAMTPTALVVPIAGQEVRVKIGAGNTNTGIAATLQLDAVAAKNIKMEDGSNPPAGTIKAGYVHTFIYDGTNFKFNSVGLALTSSGFNALGEQIKNVAPGTAATDAATVGGVEIHTNKTYTAPIINTPTINNPVLAGGTINGLTTIGFKPLATPVNLFTSTANNVDTLADMSALFAEAATAGATAAVIQARIVHSNSSASVVDAFLYVHSSAPGTTAIYRKLSMREEGTPAITMYVSGEFLVPLDGNSDFYWRTNVTYDGVNLPSTNMVIVGYYV